MHAHVNRDALVANLMEWIRLPSVHGTPENAIDLERSARWLAGALREIGFPEVEVADPGGAPAVIARWCAAPGAPTVLVYSHHDVRAAKEETWAETPAYRPVLRDGYVYGRGASDAKGQVIAHLWGLRAHLADRDVPAVNLIWLVEGEEETGSAHLAELLEQHRIEADLIVYSDTLLWHRDHPAICMTMRGGVNAQIEVFGPLRDVHSGAVSGPAPNPLVALARLIGRLHDDKGRVTLPGFYDTVAAHPAAAFAALPYSDRDWLDRTETRSIGGEEGFTVLERLWARPAVEVLTAIAGDPDGPARGAVPAVATASITVRTAPGQVCAEVADQLRRWVRDTIDEGVEYELTIAEELAQEPYRTPEDHPAVAMLADAMRDGFGTPEVGRMGNAGGGPAELLSRSTGAPVLFFGTGLPEDRWHDGDERASVDVLVAGAATLASLWTRLGQWSR
ncbi:dipeptidase [Catenuloplanes indicus JCM 9534]